MGKLTVVPTEQLAASSVLVNAFSAFLECRAGHVKLYSTADTVNSPRAWARFGQVGRLADEARRLLQIAVEDGLGDWRLPREEAAVFTRVLDEEAAKRRGDLGPKRAENFRELLRNLGTRSCWREVEGDDAGIYQLLPVGIDWAAVVTPSRTRTTSSPPCAHCAAWNGAPGIFSWRGLTTATGVL